MGFRGRLRFKLGRVRTDDEESAVAVRDEVVVVELEDLSGALIELLKERV